MGVDGRFAPDCKRPGRDPPSGAQRQHVHHRRHIFDWHERHGNLAQREQQAFLATAYAGQGIVGKVTRAGCGLAGKAINIVHFYASSLHPPSNFFAVRGRLPSPSGSIRDYETPYSLCQQLLGDRHPKSPERRAAPDVAARLSTRCWIRIPRRQNKVATRAHPRLRSSQNGLASQFSELERQARQVDLGTSRRQGRAGRDLRARFWLAFSRERTLGPLVAVQ